MVQDFRATHSYSRPFHTLVLSFYLRYPNPYSTHVITADVLSRSLSPHTHTLSTVRLLRKRGKVPSIFGNITDSWIVEESVLDLRSGGLDVRTRNVDHRTYLEAVEDLRFRPLRSFDVDSQNWVGGTWVESEGWVRCNKGMRSFRKAVEGYGIGRLQRGMEKARLGLQTVLERMDDPETREKIINGTSTIPQQSTPSLLALAKMKKKTDTEGEGWRLRERMTFWKSRTQTAGSKEEEVTG
ncbi:MSF1-domain-containing protein [Atractiella rhizophila]|nr:MSF1-domain-containing protein [Atractiella rhizophila]